MHARKGASVCVTRCHSVCVSVSKCFPWGSRQPNWHWRLARLPGYPGDRYWTASRHISRRHPCLFPFFYICTTTSALSFHTSFPKLSIPCELFYICEMPTCSPDTQTDSTSFGNMRSLSHIETVWTYGLLQPAALKVRRPVRRFCFMSPGLQCI